MNRHRNKRGSGRLLLSLAISAAILLAGLHLSSPLSGRLVLSGLLWPLVQLMLTIAAGLVVGQMIEAAGWTRRAFLSGAAAFPVRPAGRPLRGRLHDRFRFRGRGERHAAGLLQRKQDHPRRSST